MKGVTIILLSCLFYSVGLASVRGTLKLGTGGKIFTNGDIIDSQLLLWPWQENQDEKFFEKYVGKNFLEYFHVINIKNIEISNEILEVNLRIVVKKSFNGENSAQFSYGEYKIPIEIKKTGFVSNKKNVENFILFNQFEKIDRTLYYTIIILFIFLGMSILWLGFGYYKKRKQHTKIVNKIQKEREKLIFLMKNVKSKEDIQKLYVKKSQMKEIFNNSRQFKEILQMIDEHQYKNYVPDEIIMEIRNKMSNGI